MSNNLDRLRQATKQKNAARAPARPPQNTTLQIHHGHDETTCYMKIEPVPANGVLAFTQPQYVALIAQMQKTLASFENGGRNVG